MPSAPRASVAAADGQRCAYCRSSEEVTGHPLEIDHIMPLVAGGSSDFENLCLACGPCNRAKARQTRAIDPLSGDQVPIYHPRQMVWAEHFAWSFNGLYVEGLTATGRATVVALRLNRPLIVTARERWQHAGWHPPAE